jgi:hypothetical protein
LIKHRIEVSLITLRANSITHTQITVFQELASPGSALKRGATFRTSENSYSFGGGLAMAVSRTIGGQAALAARGPGLARNMYGIPWRLELLVRKST